MQCVWAAKRGWAASGTGTVRGAGMLLVHVNVTVSRSALRSSGISGCRYCWARLTHD